jgi:hypothetical protein
MPAYAVFAVVGAYGAVAVLLLSLNIVSLWRWPIKAAAVVVGTGLVVGSYVAIVAMLGWPSADPLPARAAFLASRIVEPDKLTGDPGVIFIWLQNIDEKNLPVGDPRAYRVDFDRGVASEVVKAQRLRFQGRDVVGSFAYTERPDEDKSGAPLIGQQTAEPPTLENRAGGSGGLVSLNQDLRAVFQEMPPLPLPDKLPGAGDGSEY